MKKTQGAVLLGLPLRDGALSVTERQLRLPPYGEPRATAV